MGVKTVGICHGNTTDKEVEYVHDWDGLEYPCPLPDVTTAYGEKDRRLLLTFSGYTEESVVATGSPQHDRLAYPEKRFSKDAVKTRFGAEGRKLIAVTTQPFHNVADREPWLRAVLNAAMEMPEAHVVVKPHPAESQEMHERVVRELGCGNVSVSKDVDTNELMYSSALTITSWSTTGLESMILGTPLLTVNLTGKEDIIDYASSGAAIGVYREEDIAPAIRMILEDRLPDGLRERMAQFVVDRAYRVDGGASRRIADIVKRLVSGR